MAIVLPISQKMDNVIYFSKNENNLPNIEPSVIVGMVP